MAGTLTVTGLVAGLPSGEKVIGPVTFTSQATIGQIDDLALVSGDNSIPVPTGASAVLIVFPQTNSATCKLRTNLDSSDTGLPVGSQGWLAVPIASGVTSLILNASATGVCEATFI